MGCVQGPGGGGDGFPFDKKSSEFGSRGKWLVLVHHTGNVQKIAKTFNMVEIMRSLSFSS